MIGQYFMYRSTYRMRVITTFKKLFQTERQTQKSADQVTTFRNESFKNESEGCASKRIMNRVTVRNNKSNNNDLTF